MKKRRTIAAVIACAALVVCVVLVWQNWMWIAYRQHSTNSHAASLTYHEKRPWFPGREIVFPLVQCDICYFAERPAEYEQFLAANAQRLQKEAKRFAKSLGLSSTYPGWRPSHQFCRNKALEDGYDGAAVWWSVLFDHWCRGPATRDHEWMFFYCICPTCDLERRTK